MAFTLMECLSSFFPTLKENVVVVTTAENEEGAHGFRTARQLTTGHLREDSRRDE